MKLSFTLDFVSSDFSLDQSYLWRLQKLSKLPNKRTAAAAAAEILKKFETRPPGIENPRRGKQNSPAKCQSLSTRLQSPNTCCLIRYTYVYSSTLQYNVPFWDLLTDFPRFWVKQWTFLYLSFSPEAQREWHVNQASFVMDLFSANRCKSSEKHRTRSTWNSSLKEATHSQKSATGNTVSKFCASLGSGEEKEEEEEGERAGSSEEKRLMIHWNVSGSRPRFPTFFLLSAPGWGSWLDSG